MVFTITLVGAADEIRPHHRAGAEELGAHAGADHDFVRRVLLIHVDNDRSNEHREFCDAGGNADGGAGRGAAVDENASQLSAKRGDSDAQAGDLVRPLAIEHDDDGLHRFIGLVCAERALAVHRALAHAPLREKCGRRADHGTPAGRNDTDERCAGRRPLRRETRQHLDEAGHDVAINVGRDDVPEQPFHNVRTLDLHVHRPAADRAANRAGALLTPFTMAPPLKVLAPVTTLVTAIFAPSFPNMPAPASLVQKPER